MNKFLICWSLFADEYKTLPKSTRRNVTNKFVFGSLWLPDLSCKHWFTSSVWNFCRWVADVVPCEKSPAGMRGQKRLYSQVTLPDEKDLFCIQGSYGFMGLLIVCVFRNSPFSSCLKPLFQSEAKCEAIDMKMIVFFSWTKNSLHKKGFSFRLVLKVRVFGTRKWHVAIHCDVLDYHYYYYYSFIYLSFSLFFIVRLSNMQLHLSQGTWILSSWLDVEWCEMQMCRKSYHRFEETLE